jgi:hypothetical protein
MQAGGFTRCCKSGAPRTSRYAPRSSHSPQAIPICACPFSSTSLKNRILDAGLMSKSELDETIGECEEVASNPQTTGTTFVVMQLRGRKPA